MRCNEIFARMDGRHFLINANVWGYKPRAACSHYSHHPYHGGYRLVRTDPVHTEHVSKLKSRNPGPNYLYKPHVVDWLPHQATYQGRTVSWILDFIFFSFFPFHFKIRTVPHDTATVLTITWSKSIQGWLEVESEHRSQMTLGELRFTLDCGTDSLKQQPDLTKSKSQALGCVFLTWKWHSNPYTWDMPMGSRTQTAMSRRVSDLSVPSFWKGGTFTRRYFTRVTFSAAHSVGGPHKLYWLL